MKSYSLILLIIIVVSCSYAIEKSDSATVVTSKVRSVTVYADRALITRQASCNVSPGTHTLNISGLSLSLIDQSVHVSGVGSGKAKILDVKVQTSFLDTLSEYRTKSLQAKLKELTHEKEKVSGKITIKNGQWEFLRKVVDSSVGSRGYNFKGERYPTKDELENFLRSYESIGTTTTTVLDSLLERQKELEAKIRAISDELKRSGIQSNKWMKNVLVTLSVQTTSEVVLDVSYLTNNAFWYPLYDIRTSSEADSVEIVYYGMVSQSTGEDWKGVEVNLSTAQPALSGVKPVINPWYLDEQRMIADVIETQSGVVNTSSMMASNVNEIQPANEVVISAQKATKEKQEIENRQTSVMNPGSISTSFSIPGKTDVLSDNVTKKITIITTSLKSVPGYYSVPKVRPNAFLTSTLTNTTEYPFIGGSTSVFLDDNYINSTQIANIMPGEKIEASIGIDNAVRVTRKLISKLTEYSGLFSKSNTTKYDISILIENQKKVPIHLDVRDNIPVSRNELIEVTTEAPKKDEATIDKSGIVLWSLDLKPNEKKELKLKFSVKYPSDFSIEGLE